MLVRCCLKLFTIFWMVNDLTLKAIFLFFRDFSKTTSNNDVTSIPICISLLYFDSKNFVQIFWILKKNSFNGPHKIWFLILRHCYLLALYILVDQLISFRSSNNTFHQAFYTHLSKFGNLLSSSWHTMPY